MSIDRPGYVPNPRYEGSVYQLLDEQEAVSSAMRRDTERYERNTAAIPVICEDLKRWLAEREVAFPLMPHDGGSHDR